MRSLAIAMAISWLALGCGLAKAQFYAPADSRYVEGTVCGPTPRGRARLPLGESLSTAIDLLPAKNGVFLRLQLALSPGTVVRFPNPEIRLELPGMSKAHVERMNRFQVSVFGRNGRPGHHEYFDADARLESIGRNADLAGPDTQYAKKDLFVSSMTLGVAPTDSLVFTLPAVEVNGVLLAAQTIPMRLISKTDVPCTR